MLTQNLSFLTGQENVTITYVSVNLFVTVCQKSLRQGSRHRRISKRVFIRRPKVKKTWLSPSLKALAKALVALMLTQNLSFLIVKKRAAPAAKKQW
jgi:hypothetical protein